MILDSICSVHRLLYLFIIIRINGDSYSNDLYVFDELIMFLRCCNMNNVFIYLGAIYIPVDTIMISSKHKIKQLHNNNYNNNIMA